MFFVEFSHPTVVPQLHRGHWHGLKLMYGLKLREFAPSLRQQLLDTRNITRGQINIGFNSGVAVRCPQQKTRHDRIFTIRELNILHPMAQMQFGATGLDVIQDWTGEPAMG